MPALSAAAALTVVHASTLCHRKQSEKSLVAYESLWLLKTMRRGAQQTKNETFMFAEIGLCIVR